jgi:N4-gp56 family major capsid protein
MAIQTLNSPAQRIGKIKGEMLAHAIPHEVLAIGVGNKSMPKNGGEQIIYRRWLPYGATTSTVSSQNRPAADHLAHLTIEGVTPAADTLTPVDVTVNINQYSCLYSVTDKMVDLSEDGADIPGEMKQQVGERMGLVREMVRYAALKGCTNVQYSGGTTRLTVDERLTLPQLRKMARTLKANHSAMITSILAPSPNFATAPVEASYLVFAHTDVENDIRDLPGFKSCAEYGQRKPVHELEVGSCEGFRFVLSAELAPVTDSGATAAGTGLQTTGTKVDVYPIILMAKDAAFDVALRGKDSLDPTWLPPGTKDKNDPLGQRGYVGAKFYSAAFVANGGWMGVIEAGVTAL